jgi:hypothetical protein
MEQKGLERVGESFPFPFPFLCLMQRACPSSGWMELEQKVCLVAFPFRSHFPSPFFQGLEAVLELEKLLSSWLLWICLRQCRRLRIVSSREHLETCKSGTRWRVRTREVQQRQQRQQQEEERKEQEEAYRVFVGMRSAISSAFFFSERYFSNSSNSSRVQCPCSAALLFLEPVSELPDVELASIFATSAKSLPTRSKV